MTPRIREGLLSELEAQFLRARLGLTSARRGGHPPTTAKTRVACSQSEQNVVQFMNERRAVEDELNPGNHPFIL
jgi:hypothetical protein